MKIDKSKSEEGVQGLGRYLSPLGVWALSFGSAVGWGAFLMPGTVFLPVAGPVGTAIGIGIGALVMLILGFNYHCLIKRYPDSGGAYSYVKRICNHDHGYLCAWFLILTYMAIAWANATALAVVGRKIFGGIFSIGAHYTVAGYEVYLGEVALSAFALFVVTAIFLVSKRMAARVQSIAAIILCAGIITVLCAVLLPHDGAVSAVTPPFSAKGTIAVQIISIIALAPWAFVGFENISHSVEEFKFPIRRLFLILLSVILTSVFAYVGLVLVAASTCPQRCSGWQEYVAALDAFDGVMGIPTFYAAEQALGKGGVALLCFTALAAIVTGLIGHLLAASRLLYALSRDGLMPKWFGRLNRDGSPYNSFIVLTAISCLIPFAGRTAIGWIVDVTTIGACIAYCYVSYCAIQVARAAKNMLVITTGAIGFLISLAFIMYFLVPNFWAVGVFAEESYFVLAGWSILGFVVFRGIFSRDKAHRLGKSTIVWLAMLFLIFFASHMWVRQATHRMTSSVVTHISDHYEREFETTHTLSPGEDEEFLDGQRNIIDTVLTRDNFVQMVLVVFALGIMFSIYSTMSRREREAAKAKEYFFSTVSHDIRTPLNAIIGYSQMLKLGFKNQEEQDRAVNSILISSDTLLRLINDILDLSNIEAGRMSIDVEPTDCSLLLNEIVTSFHVAAHKNNVELRTKIEPMPKLMLDPQRLRQIAFNLIGNGIKFTEKGYVEVRSSFTAEKGEPFGTFHFEVEDTGIGIKEEDQEKITSPYVRLGSKLARNGGTGLGLSICKELIHVMGGKLEISSQLGKGSKFWFDIPDVKIKESDAKEEPSAPKSAVSSGGDENRKSEEKAPVDVAKEKAANLPQKPDESPAAKPPTPVPVITPVTSLKAVADAHTFATATEHGSEHKSSARLLLVDDSKMNLMVLKALLKRLGHFEVETALDGKEAYERLQKKDLPRFDAVLTDMWMPEMDGAGLASVIREHPELFSMPIYVVTADVELQKDYAEKGFDDILLKPVTIDLLKSKCSQLFDNDDPAAKPQASGNPQA